jgi:hypothetical protein
MAFNLKQHKNHKTSAKRIKDRGINWKETYTEKTWDLKEKFEEEVGPESYFRWEGHDLVTNSDYYVVAGPGHSQEKGNMFFTGIRKLPAEYSPNGEYFQTLRKALAYARDQWAVPFPKGFKYDYTQGDLVNVEI